MIVFFFPVNSSQSCHQQHMFHRRKFVEQSIELRTIAHVFEHMPLLLNTIVTVDIRITGRRSKIPGEHSKRRRLPRSIDATKAKAFARANARLGRDRRCSYSEFAVVLGPHRYLHPNAKMVMHPEFEDCRRIRIRGVRSKSRRLDHKWPWRTNWTR